MVDVSEKYQTLRYARATGKLLCGEDALAAVRNNSVPKGDVLSTARAAGIQIGKRAAEWLVFCHPIPIEWLDVRLELEPDGIRATAEARCIARTGIEMEVMTAVSAALLNAYDMLKPLNDDLQITGITLEKKRGGKSDWQVPLPTSYRAAVLVVSTSTASGEREDESGKFLREALTEKGFEVSGFAIVPDDVASIQDQLKKWVALSIELIITTGGTGLSPTDRTPEATRGVIEREVLGIVEALRNYGLERTPVAMFSAATAGLAKNSLIINLPGSLRAVRESLNRLFPAIYHPLVIVKGAGHNEEES